MEIGDVIHCTLKTLARAQPEYDKLTGDPWFRMPEYFATIQLARALAKHKHTFVTLEYPKFPLNIAFDLLDKVA